MTEEARGGHERRSSGVPHAARALLALLVLTTLPASARPRSLGSPQGGELEQGFRVPLTGAWHKFYGPVRSRGTNYATLELAALLIRAARVVDDAVPGPPLVLGDVSAEHGGDLGHHMSHNSGRDVDVLFYVQDEDGKPVPPRGFKTFDGDGSCTGRGCEGLRFDDQRNWWFVRTLLASEDVPVQYVFVSDPLKERLIAYATARGETPEILRRARKALQQPKSSSPHADHYHVRVFCSAADRETGCRDRRPIWPWVGTQDEATKGRGAEVSSEKLKGVAQ